MAGPATEAQKLNKEWAERAALHLKAELKKAKLTYGDLAGRMKDHGFEETEASIASKLSRATVPASLLSSRSSCYRMRNRALRGCVIGLAIIFW